MARKKSIYCSRICIPTSDGYKVIKPPVICYIESKDIFCKVFTAPSGPSCIAPTRLSDIEKDLQPDIFCRIHRIYIVSLDHILEFNKPKTRVLMICGTWLPIGRTYKPNLLKQYKFWQS